MARPALRFAPLALAALLAAVPAAAETPTEKAERLAREAADQLVRALELLIGSIPQYAAPEILPNGDIIIRRKNPPAEDGEQAPAHEDPPDQTRT